ncbi:hypothetical protein [Methanooceanicella nereidis]|nr:hypothetical protein [Methanocella sp. CWC-04]
MFRKDVFYKLFNLITLISIILISGCIGNNRSPLPASGDGSPTLSPSGSRSFYMGMTPFPYDNTIDARIETYRFIKEHSDLAIHHFDSGVPWPEAFNNTPYRPNVENDLNYRVSQIKKGQQVYVAVTPIIIMRDGLTGYRGDSDNMERQGKWKDKGFTDADVIQAYTNYCKYMINKFEPDHFAYAIEANILADKDPAEFEKFPVMAEQVYSSLKSEYPDLPVFLTLHVDTYALNKNEQTEAIKKLLPYTDYIAVSTYPYTYKANPADIPRDWFSQMHDLAPEKPFAIAETGYAAEDLILDQYGATINGSEEWQAEYVNFMLTGASDLDAKFVVWFVSGDYDRLWDKMEKMGVDELFKLWKDNGLMDGDRKPRKSLDAWDKWLTGKP